MDCKFKRIINVYQDLSVKTDFKISDIDLGFEPDEVRLLQYGISNGAVAITAGVLICDEFPDFNLIICATGQTAHTSQAKMVCPMSKKGALQSIRFKFVVSGTGAPQALLPTNDIWLVLEFIKR